MRLILVLCAAAAAVAQAPQAPQASPADKQQFYRMLDEIRTNIRSDDWREAWRMSSRLNTALIDRMRKAEPPSPGLELRHLELLGGSHASTRNPLLARMAKAAFAAGDWARAERYALEALEAAKVGVFPWTGDAIHQGNIVLGRLALRKRDTESAKRYLLAAGKTPGSASLATTGPNLGLANDLLHMGETETVLQYLEECGHFWDANRGKLQEWIVLVRAGLKPDFGPNLNY